ncbi:MAG: hypothetical protein M1828_004666 [Chrysothrix sp. TS-e1954]|nr:MAG: hypothetical protein M1828_004666 [Chrysothrix sp. TS-e1954]
MAATALGTSESNEKGYSDVYLLPKANGKTEQETVRLGTAALFRTLAPQEDVTDWCTFKDLQHITFRLFNGNIFTAQIPRDVKNVLDVGCGSGVWLRDFAEQYPQAQLYGVDVNPPERSKFPAFPDNIAFKKGNIEDEWMFASDIGPSDYIFCRLLMTSLRNWDFVFAQAYQHLKPGGIIEVQETVSDLFAEDGSTATTSPAIRWHQVVRSVLEQNGVDPDVAKRLSPKLRNAGFEIVTDKECRWNTFARPEDGDREKQIAVNFKQVLLNLFEMMTPKLFEQADMSLEERQTLAKAAKQDVTQNSAQRGYYALK